MRRSPSPRRLRLAALALVALVTAGAAGCAYGPDGQIAQPPRLFTVEDSRYAIDVTFGPHGLAAEAHAVAECESRHDTYAGFANDAKYKGLFQWGPHFEPYLRQIAAELGRQPTWYDPLIQSVGTLRLVLQQRWRQWTCQP